MSALDAVERFLAAVGASDRSEVWTFRVPADQLRAEAARVDAAGLAGPLVGRLVAVKDNIDVAGCPTTAAAPSYAYDPTRDATAVARLRAAGAIVVGKTNMDQFATGLVGTRSPFGAVRHSEDPERISGGSSSGSAVAVALGLVDLALGTDTAGSGRVPAALNGLWGIKPTRGLIPATGVVPACASLDCVTVFAADPRVAMAAVTVMSGPDGADPLASREVRTPALWPQRLIVPVPEELAGMAPGWSEAFAQVVIAAQAVGLEVVERSIQPLLDAAAMLYGTAFVAERYAAVGEHIEAHRDLIGTQLDPTVASIILAGAHHTAADLFTAQQRLAAYKVVADELLADAVAILTPTTTRHPTLAEVAADPVGVNSSLGRFTNYANLLDFAALAFPAGRVDGLPFGAMLTGHAFDDARLQEVAAQIGAGVELFVVGAHRRGQVLNEQLARLGAQFVAEARTAACYRLYALETVPAKPGLVRVSEGGGAVVGELWRLSEAAFGRFVADVPAPMVIGTVLLADGRDVPGFLCEPLAITGARDITEVGDWVAWLGVSVAAEAAGAEDSAGEFAETVGR
jgi:allophanate hydrolase